MNLRPTPRNVVALSAVLGAVVLAMAASGASTPRCFGAASRDAQHPCVNRALRYDVIPTPSNAELMPNAPCDPLAEPKRPFVCWFGADAEGASATVALIGDSHATHWRSALLPIAQDEGWYGLSLTRTGCPLSDATPLLPGALRSECLTWRKQVFDYFAQHPEITTVFVSEHRVKVVARRNMSRLDAEVSGYQKAWAKLPATVTHIVVIRDTPYNRTTTAGCVNRAHKRHEDAGKVCEVPRVKALETDPAAVAARRLNSPRVGVADLTSYMCDGRACFPVIGGALVHKDTGHITALFGETLAPYLQRQLDVLLAPAQR